MGIFGKILGKKKKEGGIPKKDKKEMQQRLDQVETVSLEEEDYPVSNPVRTPKFSVPVVVSPFEAAQNFLRQPRIRLETQKYVLWDNGETITRIGEPVFYIKDGRIIYLAIRDPPKSFTDFLKRSFSKGTDFRNLIFIKARNSESKKMVIIGPEYVLLRAQSIESVNGVIYEAIPLDEDPALYRELELENFTLWATIYRIAKNYPGVVEWAMKMNPAVHLYNKNLKKGKEFDEEGKKKNEYHKEELWGLSIEISDPVREFKRELLKGSEE